MADLRVLHVIPRFNSGGASPGILAEQAHAARLGLPVHHEVLSLEAGGSAPLVLRAMRQRLRLHVAPPADRERELVEAADVVVVGYWNTPSMWSFLDRWRGRRLRWVLHSLVNGVHGPQVLPVALANSASHLVLTSPHCARLRRDEGVSVVVPMVDLPVDGPAAGGPDPGAVADRPGEDGPEVVHIGTLDVFKLDPAFVDVHRAAVASGARVAAVGLGGDAERFARRAEGLGIGAGFVWSGFAESPGDWLSGARVFSTPSSGFSYAAGDRTVQTAQLHGVPVLVYADSPIAHLVQPGVNGWWAQDRAEFSQMVAAAAAGDLHLEHDKVVHASALQHDPIAKVHRLTGIYRQVAGSAGSAVEPGCDTVADWIGMQTGGLVDPDPLRICGRTVAEVRRPPLEELAADPDLLRAHQLWACEGGLAQYVGALSAHSGSNPGAVPQ